MNGAGAKDGLKLVVFLLDAQRFAVELRQVERVVRMVALAAVPGAPEVVLGVFDFRGELVPAMNVRRRLGLPERGVRPADQLLVLQSARRRVAFAVDAVEPAIAAEAAELVAAEKVVPGLEHLRGIVRLPGHGIVFVHDIDTFLSLDEERQLGAALTEARA